MATLTQKGVRTGKDRRCRVRFAVTTQAEEMLRTLLAQGIYGSNLSEIAERLMYRQLETIFGRPKPDEGKVN